MTELLRAGADDSVRDADGCSAKDDAIRKGHRNVVVALDNYKQTAEADRTITLDPFCPLRRTLLAITGLATPRLACDINMQCKASLQSAAVQAHELFDLRMLRRINRS